MEISIQDIAHHANVITRANKAEEVRKNHGENTIVLFEVGDFMETYGESAVDMARTLGLTLTYSGNITVSAYPSKANDTYFPKLVREGYKLCVYEKGQY